MPITVGGPEFASELVKVIDARQKKNDDDRKTRQGIGVVDTVDEANNEVAVFLYGTGFPSSGGFRIRSGVVPAVGDTVSYTIDGQFRFIDGILTGDSLPSIIQHPTDGYMDMDDISSTPSNPPAGYIRIYNKGGKTYRLEPDGTESELGGGSVGDGLDPAQVQNLSLLQDTQAQSDGAIIPVFQASWDALSPDPGDLAGYEVQWDERSGGEEGDLGTPATWVTFFSNTVGPDVTGLEIIEGIIGGVAYDVRVRALDIEGKQGAWSALASARALGDEVAPADPTGLVAVPGYKLAGLTWTANGEVDLDRYEVSHQQTADPLTEVFFSTRNNAVVITGLEPDTEYTFKVRAWDRSGNTSDWSATATATPTLVGQEDVAFDLAIVNTLIANGTISASAIDTGTLKVGGDGIGGAAAVLEVYDQNTPANLMLQVTEEGLLAIDPQPVGGKTKAMRWAQGALQFTDDYQSDGSTVWTTGITGDGVIADAILLGTSPGGHNMVPNSGYELAAWAVTLSTTWTDAAHWGLATQSTNMTLTGTELIMADYT